MVRKLVLGLVALLALAGAASACPFSASNTTDETTSTSQLPTTTQTETKTGG
jgi:ABC-type glycerol-3-phosphate transport system substrate-binding protein